MTHTSTEKPEALRLAELCDNFQKLEKIGTELRRQHARIAELESWQETVRSNSPLLDELAMLVRKLVQQLRKAAPGNESAEKAVDYLKRKGLAGNPLRDVQQPKDRAEFEACEAAFKKDFCPYSGNPDPWVVWQAAWKAAQADAQFLSGFA